MDLSVDVLSVDDLSVDDLSVDDISVREVVQWLRSFAPRVVLQKSNRWPMRYSTHVWIRFASSALHRSRSTVSFDAKRRICTHTSAKNWRASARLRVFLIGLRQAKVKNMANHVEYTTASI